MRSVAEGGGGNNLLISMGKNEERLTRRPKEVGRFTLIFPDMPCMERVYKDKKDTAHWSAARNEERARSCSAAVPLKNRSSTGRCVL